MKKFLSVLLLGLLMGAVSYPILFSEVEAQIIVEQGGLVVGQKCINPDGSLAGYGNTCYGETGSCRPNPCDEGTTPHVL